MSVKTGKDSTTRSHNNNRMERYIGVEGGSRARVAVTASTGMQRAMAKAKQVESVIKRGYGYGRNYLHKGPKTE